MYTKVSVAKADANPGTGGDKKNKITVFDLDDVLTYPARDSKGIVINDNIIFKPNAYMITLYAEITSIAVNDDTDGDPDAKSTIQTVAFDHPGDSTEIREFIENWKNRNCGIIIEKMTTAAKTLHGAPEAPLQLTSKGVNDKDKKKKTMEYKSLLKGPVHADYNGTLTYDAVTDTVDADATVIDVTNGEGRYQLTDGGTNAATITTMTNAVDGNMYSILGSGGSHPSVIAGIDFVLRNGTSWTGIAGAVLTVKAIKTGTSPVAWKFIEQSRS